MSTLPVSVYLAGASELPLHRVVNDLIETHHDLVLASTVLRGGVDAGLALLERRANPPALPAPKRAKKRATNKVRKGGVKP